jgi:hypothetical protein
VKLIPPRVHAWLDYALAFTLLIAPFLTPLSDVAAITSWGMAVLHASVSLATDYPGGRGHVLRFPTHGTLELIGGLFLVGAPWILGFPPDDPGRSFFVWTGIALLAVWAVTDYRAAEVEPDDWRPSRRSRSAAPSAGRERTV